jgi:Cu/Ag efflux protein CusF
MKGRAVIVLVFLVAVWCAAARHGSAADRKPIAFAGHVDGVDKKLRTVAITHGNIPGFLPAMTNDYPVDRDELIDQLVPGDEITATVYAGDPTLYEVKVIRHARR